MGRSRIPLLAASFAILLTLVLAGPASAGSQAVNEARSPSAKLRAATQSFHVSATKSSTPTGHLAAAGSIISCFGNVQYPHNSSHVGGTVNVVVAPAGRLVLSS